MVIAMLSYISAKEAAEKWNISQRRVAVLCSEKRISGAMMVGKMWIIPSTAQKPADKRTASRKNAKNRDIKPFIKWAGGKGQLIDQLENFLPDSHRFTKYAEPMVGGGAMLFKVLSDCNFKQFYISDTNCELINTYNAVKYNVEKLIARLSEMQVSFLSADENGRKCCYYSIRDKFNNTSLDGQTSVDKAAYFIFLNKTCFNGLYRVNKKGQFNVPMGSYKNPLICDEENLRAVSAALQNVTIVCGDYTLCRDFVDEKTFVYFDPPYRPISQTSSFTAYNSQLFDDNEQIRLAEFINEIGNIGAKIVLSNSDPKNSDENDNFFDELYKDYSIHRVSATRMINSNAEGRGKINELIIYN